LTIFEAKTRMLNIEKLLRLTFTGGVIPMDNKFLDELLLGLFYLPTPRKDQPPNQPRG
jgi:hypothetical protein